MKLPFDQSKPLTVHFLKGGSLDLDVWDVWSEFATGITGRYVEAWSAGAPVFSGPIFIPWHAIGRLEQKS